MKKFVGIFLVICLIQLCRADDTEDKINSLPLPQDCKDVMKQAIPEARKAYQWIKQVVCQQGGCKPVFKELYDKYNVPVFKNKVVKEWIVDFYQKNGKPIPIPVMKKYDEIAKKCVSGDPKIMGIQNVCAASEKEFQSIKGCIVGQVMMYVPMAIGWANDGCKIAKSQNLVNAIATPTVQPNWREMVQGFVNDPMCRK